MAVIKVINLPHTSPVSKITFVSHADEILQRIENASKRAIAKIGQHIVDRARAEGSYENRTGNLRRMITANPDHAGDTPETDYQSTEITVTGANGQEQKRKQYTPPSTFDNPNVAEKKTSLGFEYSIVVAALMRYAQAVEAKNKAVLSHVINEIEINADKYVQEIMFEIEAELSSGLSTTNLNDK